MKNADYQAAKKHLARQLLVTVICLEMAAGCAIYHARPLTPASVNQALEPPSADVLRVQASSFHHPLLPSVDLDITNGLTPDSAALLAVMINPSLRAVRDQRAVAQAQVIQSGLLPNPQISYSRDYVSGGNTEGTFTAFGLGLDWDITSVLTRGAGKAAAKSEASSVDLEVAWQEWQIAEAAKLAAYQLVLLENQKELALQIGERAAGDLRAVREAADRHQLVITDVAAAEATDQEARIAVLALDQQVTHQRLVLLRALGLPSDTAVNLRHDLVLPENLPLPPSEELLSGLEERRLDLVALTRGYQSQEHLLHAAVLAQFPRVGLGFNQASDTSKVRTRGFGVSIDLPIFDRNQGVLAEEKATRQRLFDEYVSRVAEARSDVSMAVADITALNRQLAAARKSLPVLERLVDAYAQSYRQGQVDRLTYSEAVTELESGKMALRQLQQQLVENKVALELAAGVYLPDPPTTESAPNGVTP